MEKIAGKRQETFQWLFQGADQSLILNSAADRTKFADRTKN